MTLNFQHASSVLCAHYLVRQTGVNISLFLLLCLSSAFDFNFA